MILKKRGSIPTVTVPRAPGHLLEKIIRKKKEQPDKFAQLGVDNYWKYVTDLIGIRVFFLYREDWRHFHEYITSAFENAPEQYVKDRERDFDNDETHCYIAERPKVYRRNGDSRIYDENVIEINQRYLPFPSLHHQIPRLLRRDSGENAVRGGME